MELVEISLLEEKDLQECFNLCEECFHENGSFEDVSKIYQELKNNPSYYFIVAKIDGKIVGYTTMVIFYDLFDGCSSASLWYVCTHPDYRRRGIASRIFDKIEEIAKEKKCSFITFTSRFSNQSAHDFYHKMGYDDTKEKAFYKFFD